MPAARRARRSSPRSRELRETIRFFVIVVIGALLLRSLVVTPFTIPSESMLPRLLIGDYLLVAKWPYGWSRASFPGGVVPIRGRMFAAAPDRGDVVVFKTPADGRTDYVKRVIGLPGDRVRMRNGRLILNGTSVPRLRIADFVDAVTPNSPCRVVAGSTMRAESDAAGRPICRYRRYTETLPGGRTYRILDLGEGAPGDESREFTVPAGHYFLMGDNRDRSADSRFPAKPGKGIGLVPAANLAGRALVTFWSTDGSARWTDPRSWLTATRWERIGERF